MRISFLILTTVLASTCEILYAPLGETLLRESINRIQHTGSPYKFLVKAITEGNPSFTELTHLRSAFEGSLPIESRRDLNDKKLMDLAAESLTKVIKEHGEKASYTILQEFKNAKLIWGKDTLSNSPLGYSYRRRFGPGSYISEWIKRHIKTEEEANEPSPEEKAIANTIEAISSEILEEEKRICKNTQESPERVEVVIEEFLKNYDETRKLFSKHLVRTDYLSNRFKQKFYEETMEGIEHRMTCYKYVMKTPKFEEEFGHPTVGSFDFDSINDTISISRNDDSDYD